MATEVSSVGVSEPTSGRVEMTVEPLSAREYTVTAQSRVGRDLGTVGSNKAPTISNINGSCSVWVCSFTGVASDVEGDALTYRWTFGDGTPAPAPEGDPNISHTYDRSQLVSVRLVVSDAGGSSTPFTKQFRLNRAPTPKPTFVVTCFARDCSASNIVSADPDDDPLTNSWVWHTGMPPTSSPSVSYASGSGTTKTITLTVSDPYGGTLASDPVTKVIKEVEFRITAGPSTSNGSNSSNRTRRITFEWAGYDTANVLVHRCLGNVASCTAATSGVVTTTWADNLSPEQLQFLSPTNDRTFTFRMCEQGGLARCDQLPAVTFPTN